jgi:exonuclease III
MYGIVKLKSDLILLSDIRLNSSASGFGSVIKKIEQTFLVNPYCSYNFIYNSTTSSRGVGILIKNNLDVTVCAEERDGSGNILGVVLSASGNKFLIVSIYGPNRHDPLFFSNLDAIIFKYQGIPVIIGGDWNLTPSPLPAESNPDVLNMYRIPNEKHSRLLISMQLKYGLVDAYRIIHPTRQEFTYAPWGGGGRR